MSLLERLFRKSPTTADEAAAAPPTAPAVTPEPRPDAAAVARDEEAELSRALESEDMAAVGRWVLDGHSTRVRQRAAQAIRDPAQLLELIRATRGGKDKSVYRILTATREEQLVAERREAEQKAEVDAAADALAVHAGRACDATYSGTLGRLEARWRSVETRAPEELRAAVALHLERARAVVEQHREAIAAAEASKQAAALAAEEARRRKALEEESAAAAAAERARALEAEQEAERARRESEAAQVRELTGLLRQAQSAVEHGGTARAARLRDTIREKLPEAPHLPAWFAAKLQQVEERIRELQDWKTFTVVPKRAELLQQMQALVDAEISPEERAQRIRRLRDEWRTLARGGGEEPTPEWQAFEEAAERAYEPCREHFARQALQRRENQAKREELLERLAAFAAEQSAGEPDWRRVQHALVDSRSEWREYAPVDPAVVKPLQERFHAILGELQARLDAEYARNVEAKRVLIASAARLAEAGDTRQAVEDAKNLQRAWRDVGVVPRQKDHALWEEFRRQCDAVFERSAREFAARGASLESNQARAVDLCAELERIAGLSGEPLLAGIDSADGLRAEFDALELPRATARELRRRFSRASDRCAEAARRLRSAAENRGWADSFAAAAQVRAYALAVAQGRPPGERESLHAAASAAIEVLDGAPAAARSALEQQLAAIAAGTQPTDLAANEAALRMLCIRAELIAGVESPPEDQSLRREYQMQRLVASMERGERTSPADLDALALEWLAVGPVDASSHDALSERFGRCRGWRPS